MAGLDIIRWDGQPISKPGLYSGIPIDLYHGQLTVGPSISSSGLRTIFNASAAHYWNHSYLNPAREEQDEKEAFIFGRAAHHLILGEASFRKDFTIRPEQYPSDAGDKPWNGNSNWCKAWLAQARRDGLTVLTPGQIEAIRGMAAGLNANSVVRTGILNGLIEHSIVWQDEETGVWLKVRPDAIPTTDMDFADLKTAASVDDNAIEKAIGERGYHMQGALVAEACRAVFERDLQSFSLVFSEKTRPHVARVKEIKPGDLSDGAEQNRAALRMFARCLERGEWPGPGGVQTDAEYADLKPFHRDQALRRLAALNSELEAA